MRRDNDYPMTKRAGSRVIRAAQANFDHLMGLVSNQGLAHNDLIDVINELKAQIDVLTTMVQQTPLAVALYKSGSAVTTVADSDFDITPDNGALAIAHNTDDDKSYLCGRTAGSWKTVQIT